MVPPPLTMGGSHGVLEAGLLAPGCERACLSSEAWSDALIAALSR